MFKNKTSQDPASKPAPKKSDSNSRWWWEQASKAQRNAKSAVASLQAAVQHMIKVREKGEQTGGRLDMKESAHAFCFGVKGLMMVAQNLEVGDIPEGISQADREQMEFTRKILTVMKEAKSESKFRWDV
jgi:hypothetical protein